MTWTRATHVKQTRESGNRVPISETIALAAAVTIHHRLATATRHTAQPLSRATNSQVCHERAQGGERDKGTPAVAGAARIGGRSHEEV